MIREFKFQYKWLSNFAPVRVDLDGVTYPTVEHAYMSAKSNDPEWKKKCTNSNISPGEIKRLSRGIELVPNWELIKLVVMHSLLVQKFNQEPYKTRLKNTGTTHLQEGNLWGDEFWGVSLKTGKGANNLGKLIMQIRNEESTSRSHKGASF